MKKQIDTRFFEEFTNVSTMESNGGDLFCFTKIRASVEEDRYFSDLFVYDMTNDLVTHLWEEGSVPAYAWLNADTLIVMGAFLSEDKVEAEKGIPYSVFGTLDVKNGVYTRLFHVYHTVIQFKAIDQDRFLLLTEESPVRDDWLQEAEGDWDRYLKIKEREERFIVADEFPYYADRKGFLNKERGSLYFYNQGELVRLTQDEVTVCEIDSYKDLYGVYYLLDAGGYQKNQGRLYLLRYDSMEISCLDASMEYIYTKVQAVDENRILVMRNDSRLHGEYQDEFIDVINIHTGEYTRNNQLTDWNVRDNVLCDLTYNTGGLSRFIVEEEGFYMICTAGGSSDLYYARYDEDQSLRKVTMQDGKLIDYVLKKKSSNSDEGDLFMIAAMRDMGGVEFYELNTATGEEIRKSAFHTQVNELYQIPKTEEISFVNSDGILIEGWAMKPTEYEEGKQYPTILFIHGGPECAWGPILMQERLLFTANGYGAIFCNPRGSEGRGAAFCDIRGRWMDVDYRDLMEFTDHAIKNCPWIDPARVGITGGSYGGIMTNLIIGHTNRFKAAVSDRSSADAIMDYLLCDLGVACGYDTYQTTPWENPMLLWEQSALKYAPNIKTPVLLIHGAADYRCPFVNALMFHSAITYHGGISKVVGFKGEKHGLSKTGKPFNRNRRLEEYLNWFEKFLNLK